MKHLFKRVTACLLCMALLAVPMQLSPVTATAQTEAPVLAYVPLDDRPVVVDRVQYAATAAGFDVQFPPDKSWYQTHLDNQLVNEDNPDTEYTNESQVGNGAAIMDWLEEMEESGCDHYVIHLDMMFSGGLVGSRFPDEHYDADGLLIIDEQLEIANRLAVISENPENHVYFVDTVMRLAPTSGFKGYELSEYQNIREFAKQPRWDLNEAYWQTKDYTLSCNVLIDPNDSIYSYYKVPAKGETWDTDNFGLNDKQIERYYRARQRKLRLLNYMMQYASSSYYIIGVDDASPDKTIQTNEIDFIHARMQAMGIGYSLFADTDSAAMMALARCAVDYYCDGAAPKASVTYYGERSADPADQYDIGVLTDNVTTHITCAGLELVDSEADADIQVLVLTRIGASNPSDTDPTDDYTNATTDQKQAYESNVAALVEKADANLAADIPTIVLDCSASSNKAYAGGTQTLQDELLEQCDDIGRLIGYSNWNTVGNTLGIGIGQGVSRYAYLQSDAVKTAEATIAAAQSIVYSYVKDIVYVARHKIESKGGMFFYELYNDTSNNGDPLNSMGGTLETVVDYWGSKGWKAVNGNMYAVMLEYNEFFKTYNYTGERAPRDYEITTTERWMSNWLDYRMQQGDDDSTTYSDSYVSIVNILTEDTIYTDLSGDAPQSRGFGAITLSNFRFPWYRLFEITFNIAVELEDHYTYTDQLVVAPIGTTAEALAEDVMADHTAQASTEMFGQKMAYVDYKGTTHTLAAAGPAIYTDATIAATEIHALDGTVAASDAAVGTGFTVTANGTTYTVVVHCDTDGNGKVDSSDVRSIMKSLLGTVTYSAAQTKAADHDGNGRMTSTDARRILQDVLKG